jgi:hypothetical protein
MGCTPSELAGSLHQALAGAVVHIDPHRSVASAVFDDGALHLEWQSAPARQIALLSIPRTLVRFRYERLSPARRVQVQRRFDLVYQRGGG